MLEQSGSVAQSKQIRAIKAWIHTIIESGSRLLLVWWPSTAWQNQLARPLFFAFQVLSRESFALKRDFDLLSRYVFGHYPSAPRGAVLSLSYRGVETVVLHIYNHYDHHECVHCQIKTSPPCLTGDVACIRCFTPSAAVLHLTFLFPPFLYEMTHS